MLDVRYSTRFKKDFKTCVKRGLDVSIFQNAVDTLRIPAPLPEKNKDHNWLLIYQQTETELLLQRTGTHADLFGM